MMDDDGKLLTTSEEINELAVQKLAVERLKNKPMKENLKEMKAQKELICEKNLENTRRNKTPDRTYEEVKEVLNNSKPMYQETLLVMQMKFSTQR